MCEDLAVTYQLFKFQLIINFNTFFKSEWIFQDGFADEETFKLATDTNHTYSVLWLISEGIKVLL